MQNPGVSDKRFLGSMSRGKNCLLGLVPIVLMGACAMGACGMGAVTDVQPLSEGPDAGFGRPNWERDGRPDDVDNFDFGNLAWSSITPSLPTLGAAMHYVSDDRIYAFADNRIRIWNGEEWGSHTSPQSAMVPAFHFFDAEEAYDIKIYAIVGDKISRWTGEFGVAGAWTVITDAQPGIGNSGTGDLHVVSESEMYVMASDRIRKWNGSSWVSVTSTIPELARSFHLVSPEEMYAVAGDKVVKWSGSLGAGGSWSEVTSKRAGLVGGLHVISDQQLYAVADDSVYEWDGTVWTPRTSRHTGLGPAIHFESPERITAIAGTEVVRWEANDRL